MCAFIQLIDFRMRFPLGGKIIMETVSCSQSLKQTRYNRRSFSTFQSASQIRQEREIPFEKMRLIIISLSLPPNLSPLFSRMTSTANQNTLSHLLPHLTLRDEMGKNTPQPAKDQHPPPSVMATSAWSFPETGN